jgi:Succinate dehydrogenase/fumarate reductase, flavoprotein subunit
VGRYKVEHLQTDLLIIGGGTAGCFAAVKAKEAAPELDVLILEKGTY